MLKTFLALAEFAPSILAFFNNNREPIQTAKQIEALAKETTGSASIEEALKVLGSDPSKVQLFRIKIAEAEYALQVAFLADTNAARLKESIFMGQGQRNYRADVLSVLAIVVIVSLVLLIWQSPELNEYVKGVFTLVLGRFMGYIDNIYNFEFGSTRSSKQKDSTINSLSEK